MSTFRLSIMRRTDDGRDALVLCTTTRRTARSTIWWHVRRRGRQKRCQRSATDQPSLERKQKRWNGKRQIDMGTFDNAARFINQYAPRNVAQHAANGTSAREQSPDLAHDSPQFLKKRSSLTYFKGTRQLICALFRIHHAKAVVWWSFKIHCLTCDNHLT